MKTENIDNTHAARRAIKRMLVAANGGTTPRITVHVADGYGAAVPALDPRDTTSKLVATIDSARRLDVSVGIQLHWKTLWHPNFRFARTPGGQLILLGSFSGPQGHFAIEDDRLWCTHGSPLLSAGDEQAAMVAFDAEFSALMAEMA